MDKRRTEADARGQYAGSQADRHNDGVASATPPNVTGEEDATLSEADKKKAPGPGFDTRSQTNKRG
jgi:hypothetical protein